MSKTSNELKLIFICVNQILEGNKVTNVHNYVILDKETKDLPSMKIVGAKHLDSYYEALVSDITEYSHEYLYKKLIDCKVREDGGVDIFLTVSLNITNYSGFNRFKFLNLEAYELYDLKELDSHKESKIDLSILSKCVNWCSQSDYGRKNG